VDDNFLYSNSEFSPYSEINFNCSYTYPENIRNLNSNNLSAMSLNIQSLPAKFTELNDMINGFSYLTLIWILYVCKKFGKSLIPPIFNYLTFKILS
jgi:hypothetical protein